MAKKSRAAKVRAYMKKHPTAKAADIAKEFGITLQNVYVIRSLMKKAEKKPVKVESARVIEIPKPLPIPENYEVLTFTTANQSIHPDTPRTLSNVDMVNSPPHYKTGGVETINFIEAKGLDYHLGNVVKYITRAGKKADELEDLRKARWYLERAISVRENTKAA